MKLSLILAQARSGELDSLSKKDKTDEKVVGYINLALIALYSRFQLATEEAIIRLRPDLLKTIYTMDSTDADVTVRGLPMTDDEFMSIVAAYDEGGTEIKVNDEKDMYAILTASYNKLQVPLLGNDSYISVIYRQNPELVAPTYDLNGVASEAHVPIPVQLLECLLHYVGYRAHGAVNGAINTEHNTHYMRYEAACRQVEELGMLTPDDVNHNGVDKKGYV